MADKPEKLNERYTLWEKIASGGMADVYRATEYGAKGSSKTIALKKILSNFSSNPEYRRMFIDEGIIGSQLTHANICQVNPLIEIDENLYIPMEYIEGKNLRQVINKHKKRFGAKPLPVPFSIYVVNEVFKGLDYAHTKLDENTGKPLNIVHRDMSPQNIMLSYQGGVKLIDFGIAKAKILTSETRAGVIKGKYSYMSPEQAIGNQLGPQSDVFSTGIVLWEMLTGERLFQSENDMATLKAIQDCDLTNLEPIKKNAEVNPELNRMVMKLLTKDLTLRFKSAEQAQQALQKYLNDKFGSYSSRDIRKFLEGLFAEEIVAERKKANELYSTTVTNSQRKSVASSKDLQQVAQAFEGDITKTEVSESGGLTNTSYYLDEAAESIMEEIPPDRAKVDGPTLLEPSEKTAVSIDQENFRVPSMFGEDNKLDSHLERSATHAAVAVETEVPLQQQKQQSLTSDERAKIELAEVTNVKKEGFESSWNSVGGGEVENSSQRENQSETFLDKSELELDNTDSTNQVLQLEDGEPQQAFQQERKSNYSWVVLGALFLVMGTASIYYMAFLSKSGTILKIVNERGPRVTAGLPKTSAEPATPKSTALPENISYSCKVTIETDPPGANLLGENFNGSSSTGSISVPCNEAVVIRIEKPGYEPYKISVNTANKPTQTIPRINLQIERRGSIVLTVDNNSSVVIDGKDYGSMMANTPSEFKLSPGSHRFIFKNDVLGLMAERTFQIVDKERVVENKTIRLNDSKAPSNP